MAHVSHRLTGAFEGALAGGGDPATSPLYVFGPFLRLLVASGAGAVAFGTPIWMVVATVAVVSSMYRHVMEWIPDGSGGSGLCEEEFGGWAVKVNAAITAIEYTLTFLVSLAALVTFVADRAGGLGHCRASASPWGSPSSSASSSIAAPASPRECSGPRRRPCSRCSGSW